MMPMPTSVLRLKANFTSHQICLPYEELDTRRVKFSLRNQVQPHDHRSRLLFAFPSDGQCFYYLLMPQVATPHRTNPGFS
jgi:hypothetical protein